MGVDSGALCEQQFKAIGSNLMAISKIINKILKGHEFEREWKGVCGRAWRKETEERNTIINLYSQKQNIY